MALNEENITLQASRDAKGEKVEKWKNERVKNEEYIEQMRRRKEERKRELAEIEALRNSIEDDKNEDIPEDILDEMEIKDSAKNIDTNKVSPINAPFKPKEQVELEQELKEIIKPFDIQSLDSNGLKNKAQELFQIIGILINEKLQLTKRMTEQDKVFNNLQTKLDDIAMAKAVKKGVDMEKFYPGQHHPPKMQILSKYQASGVKKGERTYDERKTMYDTGITVVRPKMLEDMWNMKFSAWMESPDAGKSFEEGYVQDN